jgi:DNA-binding NarL/FixJ family response regulator
MLGVHEMPRDVSQSVGGEAALPSAKARTALSAASTIRIALMSDNALFRSGLRRLFGMHRTFLIVAEMTWPAARDPVRGSSPHVVVVDAQMEGALAVCDELRLSGIRARVILAGANGDDGWAIRALKLGARGVLSKSAPVESLLKAVRVVHQGQVWASKRVIALTIDELVAGSKTSGVTESIIRTQLSPREREVVQLIVRGLSNLEVAAHLRVTEATVKAHLTHIFQKLALRGRGQLAARYHHSFAPPGAEAGSKPLDPRLHPRDVPSSDAARRRATAGAETADVRADSTHGSGRSIARDPRGARSAGRSLVIGDKRRDRVNGPEQPEFPLQTQQQLHELK